MSPPDFAVRQRGTLALCFGLCLAHCWGFSSRWVPSQWPGKTPKPRYCWFCAPEPLNRRAAGNQDISGRVTFVVVILVTAPGLVGTALHPQPWEHSGILSIHGVTSGILGALSCSLGRGFVATDLRSTGSSFGCFKLHHKHPPVSVCVQGTISVHV